MLRNVWQVLPEKTCEVSCLMFVEGMPTGLGMDCVSSIRSARALVVRKMSSSAITVVRARLSPQGLAYTSLADDRDLSLARAT